MPRSIDSYPNYDIAKQAVDYARSMIKRSYTSFDTSDEEAPEVLRLVTQARKGCFSKADSIKELFRVQNYDESTDAWQEIKVVVKKTKVSHVGNCGEYAYLVLNYLVKKGISYASVMEIRSADHAFVVINLSQFANQRDPLTWGSDALVIDAWAMRKSDEECKGDEKYSNAIYPASEIYKHMTCYKCENEKSYPFSHLTHFFSTATSISDQRLNKKNELIEEARSKLLLLHTVINSFRKKINGMKQLGFKIVDEYTALQPVTMENALSTLFIARTLNKKVSEFLKRAMILAEEENLKEEFENALITHWIAYRKNLDSTLSTRKLYYVYVRLLWNHPVEVILPVLKELPSELVNKLAQERHNNSYLIERILYYHRDENYFCVLLSHLSRKTIKFLDSLPLFYVTDSKQQQMDCDIIHVTLSLHWSRGFLEVLKKINDKQLSAYIEEVVADKVFSESILLHLDVIAVKAFLDRLSLDDLNYIADQNSFFEKLRDYPDTIKTDLLQGLKTKFPDRVDEICKTKSLYRGREENRHSC